MPHLDHSDFVTAPVAAVVCAFYVPHTLASIVLVPLGVLAWTFVEYWLHRGLHSRLVPYARAMHVKHHQRPKDAAGGTLYSTAIIAGLVALAVFGSAAAFVTGVLIGYAAFIVLHAAMHFAVLDGLVFRALAENHEIHHHAGPGRMFGVTTSLWDHVFGTA